MSLSATSASMTETEGVGPNGSTRSSSMVPEGVATSLPLMVPMSGASASTSMVNELRLSLMVKSTGVA